VLDSRKLSELEYDASSSHRFLHIAMLTAKKRREDALALLMLRKNQQYYLPIFVGHLK